MFILRPLKCAKAERSLSFSISACVASATFGQKASAKMRDCDLLRVTRRGTKRMSKRENRRFAIWKLEISREADWRGAAVRLLNKPTDVGGGSWCVEQ
jgi:hypothetical protein